MYDMRGQLWLLQPAEDKQADAEQVRQQQARLQEENQRRKEKAAERKKKSAQKRKAQAAEHKAQEAAAKAEVGHARTRLVPGVTTLLLLVLEAVVVCHKAMPMPRFAPGPYTSLLSTQSC